MKLKIHKACQDILQQKIEELQLALNAATEAANSETKSSVGDKHETARAMMQLEQEKITKQLNEALDQKSEFEKIDIQVASDQIRKGSLIKTDKNYLFMSVGIGKLTIDNEIVFAISPQSPIGLKLMGLKEKNSAEMNGINYTIQSIS